jgi:hypothetical protein
MMWSCYAQEELDNGSPKREYFPRWSGLLCFWGSGVDLFTGRRRRGMSWGGASELPCVGSCGVAWVERRHSGSGDGGELQVVVSRGEERMGGYSCRSETGGRAGDRQGGRRGAWRAALQVGEEVENAGLCTCSISRSHRSHGQEWVVCMGPLLETIFVCYNGVLDPILGFGVFAGDSLTKWASLK